MKSLHLIFAFTLCAAVLGQQDMTAEWKASINDLERRISGLNPDSGSGMELWRADAEALRSSIASYAASC